MKKLFAIFVFSFLLLAFSSSPARADGLCGEWGDWDSGRGCCNYGIERNPFHIKDPDPLCTAEPRVCQKTYPEGDQVPYGPCLYCNPNVAKHGTPCYYTCNWSCAPDDVNGDDEGDCHMEEDKNLIACCPVLEVAPTGLISKIIEWLQDAVAAQLPVTLKVTDFRVSEKFEEAADYYYGKTYISETGEEELEEGAFFKLAPPNLLQGYFPTEEAKIERREEYAKWIVSPTNTSGDDGGDALNDGKLKNVEPYRLAVNNLRDFLVGIPNSNGPTAYKPPETVLATQGLGEVLSSDDVLCGPKVVEAETKGTCTSGGDAPKRDADPSNLFDFIAGKLNLYTKIADLDFLGNNTTGVPTTEGAAADDPNYGPGFLQIFNLPGKEYEELNAEGSVGLVLNITNVPIIGTWSIDLGRRDLELSYQGSDTEAREKKNGVYAKLSVPQAENGAALLRQDYGEPSVVLAATNPPLDPLTPLNVSFAEKLGRTLGTWLAKIITL